MHPYSPISAYHTPCVGGLSPYRSPRTLTIVLFSTLRVLFRGRRVLFASTVRIGNYPAPSALPKLHLFAVIGIGAVRSDVSNPERVRCGHTVSTTDFPRIHAFTRQLRLTLFVFWGIEAGNPRPPGSPRRFPRGYPGTVPAFRPRIIQNTYFVQFRTPDVPRFGCFSCDPGQKHRVFNIMNIYA